jgi:hypothetical protein
MHTKRRSGLLRRVGDSPAGDAVVRELAAVADDTGDGAVENEPLPASAGVEGVLVYDDGVLCLV